MDKRSSHTLQITRRAAAIRLRQLIDEFHLLTSSFPDLRDAFDPDELPIEFILKRDSQAESDPTLKPVRRVVTPIVCSMPSRGAGHRESRKTPVRDD
jgi:hypothetical protein